MLNLIYLYFTIKNLLKKGWGFNPHMAVMTYAISKSLIFVYINQGVGRHLGKRRKKNQILSMAVEWPQTSVTVAVGLKSSATAVDFGLRSNTGT